MKRSERTPRFHFPLVRNELLRHGRRGSTYWARVSFIAIMLAPLALIAWGQWHYGVEFLLEPDELGQGLTIFSLTMQCIAAFAVAPTVASTALTQEKEERTLGLLLMAELRGWDVIASKFAIVMVKVVTLILCSAPFLGFAALFGAVDVPSAIGATTALTVCAASVTATGIFFSTVLRYSSMANLLTVLIVLAVAWALAFIDFELFPGGRTINPVSHFVTAAVVGGGTASAFQNMVRDSILGSALVLSMGVLFLAGAVAALPNQVHVGVRRPGYLKGGLRRSSLRFWRQDPLSRLVTSCAGSITMAGRNVFVRLLALIGLCIVLLAPLIGCLFVTIVLFREIILSIDRLRKDGALDDFVLVPQSDTELGRAFWWGYLNAAKIYGALILASFLWGRYAYEFGHLYLSVLMPITAAQFSAAVAIACLSGTFPVRIGSLGAYVFVLALLIGYVGPPVVYVLLRSGTWPVLSWYDMLATGQMEAVYQRIGGPAGLTVYVALNIAFFAGITAAACWAAGRRLRNRPLFAFESAPARPRAGAAVET